MAARHGGFKLQAAVTFLYHDGFATSPLERNAVSCTYPRIIKYAVTVVFAAYAAGFADLFEIKERKSSQESRKSRNILIN